MENKITAEQIESILGDYGGMHDGGTEDCAAAILALFDSPPRKPLSELHKSEEDCRNIADHMCFYFESAAMDDDQPYIRIYGQDKEGDYPVVLIIWNDGCIYYLEKGEDTLIGNPFLLVDLIRSLGYDVVNLTDNAETR